MTRACRCRYHKPCAIHRGWSGLLRRACSYFIFDFSWKRGFVTIGTPLFYIHAAKQDWMKRFPSDPIIEGGWLPANWDYISPEGASRFRYTFTHHFKEKC